MKTKTMYPPAYNNAKQVIAFVASSHNVDPEHCEAELKMVVGWTGEKLITSTDWHVKYPDPNNANWKPGMPRKNCIVPPCVCPQYETFAPIKIGYHYSENGYYKLQYFDDRAKLCFDGLYEPLEFAGAETVIEKVFHEGEKIILLDCEVETINTWHCREYHVIIDEDTKFGEFVNGKLCLITNQKAG